MSGILAVSAACRFCGGTFAVAPPDYSAAHPGCAADPWRASAVADVVVDENDVDGGQLLSTRVHIVYMIGTDAADALARNWIFDERDAAADCASDNSGDGPPWKVYATPAFVAADGLVEEES